MSHFPKTPLDYFPVETGTDSPTPRPKLEEPATRPAFSESGGGYDAMVRNLSKSLARRNAQARKGAGAPKDRSRKALSRVLEKIMDQDS